jgi:hypothetical protein
MTFIPSGGTVQTAAVVGKHEGLPHVSVQTPPPFFVSLLIEAEIVVLELGAQWTRATHRRARLQALPSSFTGCD